MPLQVKIKLFLKKILPTNLFTTINKLWRATFAKYIKQDTNVQKYFENYVTQNGLVVSGGPFAGMRYISESTGSVLLNKLIGCYEEILHAPFEKIKTEDYTEIIDIGCAEGYYLAGLGKVMPQTHLIGYDIDEKALSLTKKLILNNKISNQLTLDPSCSYEKLTDQISDNTLIICDAEGYEVEILNPEKCPALKRVKKFVIETHDFAAPGVVSTLKERFNQTHNIEEITFKPATKENYPFLKTFLNEKDLFYFLRERGEQEQIWLIMNRK